MPWSWGLSLLWTWMPRTSSGLLQGQCALMTAELLFSPQLPIGYRTLECIDAFWDGSEPLEVWLRSREPFWQCQQNPYMWVERRAARGGHLGVHHLESLFLTPRWLYMCTSSRLSPSGRSVFVLNPCSLHFLPLTFYFQQMICHGRIMSFFLVMAWASGFS